MGANAVDRPYGLIALCMPFRESALGRLMVTTDDFPPITRREPLGGFSGSFAPMTIERLARCG